MHCMVYYTRYLQVNNAQISNECKYTDSMYTLRILSVLKMLRVAPSDPSCWSFCISKVGTGEYKKYRHVSDCFWTCGIKMQQVCEDWCSCLFAIVVTHYPAVRCWIWHEIWGNCEASWRARISVQTKMLLLDVQHGFRECDSTDLCHIGTIYRHHFNIFQWCYLLIQVIMNS